MTPKLQESEIPAIVGNPPHVMPSSWGLIRKIDYQTNDNNCNKKHRFYCDFESLIARKYFFKLHGNGEKSHWQLFGSLEVLVQLNYRN